MSKHVYVVTKGERSEGASVLGVFQYIVTAQVFAEKIEGVSKETLVEGVRRPGQLRHGQNLVARWNLNSVDYVEITRWSVL